MGVVKKRKGRGMREQGSWFGEEKFSRGGNKHQRKKTPGEEFQPRGFPSGGMTVQPFLRGVSGTAGDSWEVMQGPESLLWQHAREGHHGQIHRGLLEVFMTSLSPPYSLFPFYQALRVCMCVYMFRVCV